VVERLGLRPPGNGNLTRVGSSLGGFVDGSPRRRGQLLVVVGALLGTLVGVTLGLAVDDPGDGTATAAPGPDRGVALAASAPGSQPPTARTVGTGSGTEDAGPADRPGKARGEDRDKPKPEGHGKGRTGKDKHQDKPGKAKPD
jgi:hypothetical protein